MARERHTLALLNDPVLRPYITADAEPARLVALERIVNSVAQPAISRVLRQCRHNLAAAGDGDPHEIESTVIVRVLQKLESARTSPNEAVVKLDEYVARLTVNAVADLRRNSAPEWTRLKRRLRYAAETDRRLALWDVPSGTLCGLAEWRDRVDRTDGPRVDRLTAPAAMRDPEAPGDALVALLRLANAPVALDEATAALAELWHVEPPEPPAIELADDAQGPVAAYETREELQLVWEEIRGLPLNQRAALLLNLRDAMGLNAVVLFPLTGVASFDEIAETIGMTPAALTGLWPQLPLADLDIARTLDLERQQVINLRKAARARLQRRIAGRQKGWR